MSVREYGSIDGVSDFFGMRWQSADTVRMEARPSKKVKREES